MTGIINFMGKPKRAATRKDGWTKAKRKLFLDVLAATAHVGGAAKAAGLSACTARRLRGRDPAFAELWREALELAYGRLEDELLAYALGEAAQSENPGPDRDEPPAEHRRPFDPELALRLLGIRGRKRGARSERSVPPISPAEVDAALMRKLDGLAKRMGGA